MGRNRVVRRLLGKNDSWRALSWLWSVLTSSCIKQCGHGFKHRKGTYLEAALWRRFMVGYIESHKWTKKSITRILNFFQYFSAAADYQSSFLLSVQGVLNRQRCLGLKDAPVFPSFVELRAVKGRDAFTWGNHSTTLLSSFLLFAIVVLLFLLKTGADGFPFTSEN